MFHADHIFFGDLDPLINYRFIRKKFLETIKGSEFTTTIGKLLGKVY